MTTWDKLQNINKECGAEFYEGIVAKRDTSPYNLQLISPDQTTCDGIKWRWDW